MNDDFIYSRLEKIKDIANGINSTNCHQKRVQIREIADEIQLLLLKCD